MTNSNAPHDGDQSSATEAPRRAPLRRLGSTVATAVVFVACLLLAATAVGSAQSRFGGSTSNEGSRITTGAVDIVVEDANNPGELAQVEVLFDISGMVAGQRADRCIVTTYRGSVTDVVIGFWGDVTGGTGLEEHLRVDLAVGSGTSGECDDFELEEQIYSATLAELGRDHAAVADALPLLVDPVDGQAVTARISLTLTDSNEAQGRTTSFALFVEART